MLIFLFYCVNNIYKSGSIVSACFLLDENLEYNYILPCNFFLFKIAVTDISGNKDKNKDILIYSLILTLT